MSRVQWLLETTRPHGVALLAWLCLAMGTWGLLSPTSSLTAWAGPMAQSSEEAESAESETPRHAHELRAPVRLKADGEPIDIGKLSNIAHAGPWIADVDGDGDRDLLVGDFPGYFWLFENEGNNTKPKYTSRGKLEAGGEAAKTPVY